MSSNLRSPYTGEIVRDTFGIKDNITGQKYDDIKKTFLELRYITKKDFENGFIFLKKDDINSQLFILHCDTIVRNLFKYNNIEDDSENTEVSCILSFQYRTTGEFVFARFFETHQLRKDTSC